MERNLASRILSGALALDKALGDLDIIIAEIPNQKEKQEYARRLGEIIGQVNDSLIRPIARQYPDLHPEEC